MSFFDIFYSNELCSVFSVTYIPYQDRRQDILRWLWSQNWLFLISVGSAKENCARKEFLEEFYPIRKIVDGQSGVEGESKNCQI